MKTSFSLLLVLALSLAACSGGDAETASIHPTPVAAVADAARPVVTVYKNPACGCCSKWIDHVREAGFPVETVDVADLNAVKARHGIPVELGSCHTAVVDGYAVEGHVPVADIERLLAERPDAAGIAVPGMPLGSPGMEVPGRPAEPYDVLLVRDGEATVFARH